MGIGKAPPPTVMGMLLLQSIDDTTIGLVGWSS